ncbi:MAG: hypothetical protein ACOYL6_07465 [Bacteriovoracaceae bacterium]
MKIISLVILFICGNTFAQDLRQLKEQLTRNEKTLQIDIEDQRQNGLSPDLVPLLLNAELTLPDQQLIKEWYLNESKLQNRYDQFQNLKLDYFARLQLQKSSCLQKKFLNSKKVQQAFQTLQNETKDYFEKKSLFGSQEDYLRVLAYNRTYRAQINLSKKLKKALKLPLHQLSDKLTDLGQKLTLIPNQLDIIWNLRFKQQSAQGKTPIIDAMGRAVSKLGREEDIQVTWYGLENIPKPKYNGKTLNILAFEHANSFLDTIAQAEIPSSFRQGIGFYGAAKYVFPASWVRDLEKSDHYIVVNQGKEISRTLEIIKAKKLHGFFASAEGLSPSGLFETRPVNPLFTNTYWELRKVGLDVNIVPMSYPQSFRLYNEWKNVRESQKNISGVIKPKLSAHNADKLLQITGDKNSVGIWLRSAWHQSLDNQKTLLASPKVIKIEQMIDELLWKEIDQKMKIDCSI